MKLLLLHLSDIHIRAGINPVLDRHQKIAETLLSVIPDVAALFVVITGDIAFSGNEDEYKLASTFLDSLLADIKKQCRISIHVVMVPGNHDGEFKNAGNGRRAIIETVRSKGESYIDDDVIKQCTAPQKHYFDFERRFANAGLESNDPLWKEYRFNIDDKIIGFSAINASWMSQVPEEPGKLVFPVKRYASIQRPDSAINIVLLHHPLNWYAQETYHSLRDLCHTNFQIVMSGCNPPLKSVHA